MLVAGAVVYVGARLVAEIHVEAKALAIDRPARRSWSRCGRCSRPANADPASRSAPSSSLPPPARPCSRCATPRSASTSASSGSSSSPSEAEGEPVAFLGVDRFAGYYLRGTLARAPGRLRARGDRRPPGQELAAGPGGRLRHASTRASSTGSATRSRPPPPTQSTAPPNFEPVDERRRLRALAAPGRDPAGEAAPARGQQRAGAAVFNPGAAFECPAAAEARRRGGGARRAGPRRRSPSGASRRRRGARSPGRSAAGRRRARRRTELELPARAGELRALAAVPLAGAADGARRRRGGRRAAGLARGHVPERRRARRLLAGGRDRRRRRRGRRGHRPRRRAERPRRHASTPAAWSGSATSPPRRSPGRGRSRSPTPAATTSTTTPTSSGDGG